MRKINKICIEEFICYTSIPYRVILPQSQTTCTNLTIFLIYIYISAHWQGHKTRKQ